ncbi:hypothetical protein QCA50_005338 [Cerrena zonata]|uniref:Uncharacterized protein n=1 Tax=Cerrena zonata TaxID=2478898 RepID=A0AAW0GEK9_9APHY
MRRITKAKQKYQHSFNDVELFEVCAVGFVLAQSEEYLSQGPRKGRRRTSSMPSPGTCKEKRKFHPQQAMLAVLKPKATYPEDRGKVDSGQFAMPPSGTCKED